MREILAAVMIWLGAGMAVADVTLWSSTEAQAALARDEIVLIDIRRPEEWQATGVAKGAWPLDMRTEEFGQQLGAILDRNPSRRLALICATGVRSAYVAKLLDNHGIDVIDVSEGMMGSIKGPGWVRRGLPVLSAFEASKSIPKYLSTR